MREILFRGKRIDNLDNGEWVEGNLFIPDEGHDAPTQICIGTNIVRITYDVDPDTVSEFTGLYDKNGKRIFEGDIIKARPSLPPYEVIYENAELKIRNKYGNILLPQQEAIIWTEAQIIGNKWDNPEFLDER